MLSPPEGQVRPRRVAVVDDDAAVLRAVSRMLSAAGYDVSAFLSGHAILASLDALPLEALLIDFRLPGIDGLALQSAIRQRGYRIPTVFLTAHGDVPTSVRAIRDGAIDFLEKPCEEQVLLASIERAISVAHRERDLRATVRNLTEQWALLTAREREVCRLVVSGRLNKQIAAALGTTEKTVKVHRARVMTKMRADSVAALVRSFDLLDDRVTNAPRKPPRDESAQPRVSRRAIDLQRSRPRGGLGNPT
jgi:FixJ family two-component response regulator